MAQAAAAPGPSWQQPSLGPAKMLIRPEDAEQTHLSSHRFCRCPTTEPLAEGPTYASVPTDWGEHPRRGAAVLGAGHPTLSRPQAGTPLAACRECAAHKAVCRRQRTQPPCCGASRTPRGRHWGRRLIMETWHSGGCSSETRHLDAAWKQIINHVLLEFKQRETRTEVGQGQAGRLCLCTATPHGSADGIHDTSVSRTPHRLACSRAPGLW